MAATVLIVEDDEYVGYVEKMAIQKAGYAVHWVRNGKEALKCAQENRPDAVVMDIMMPEQDGFETAKALRRDCGLPRTPILFVSVLNPERGVRDRLPRGPVHYIQKPFELEVLIKALKRMVRRHL
jgi:two-component system OmpR family response regulator